MYVQNPIIKHIYLQNKPQDSAEAHTLSTNCFSLPTHIQIFFYIFIFQVQH